jgi:hypothetical protein
MHCSSARLGERAYYLAHARVGSCTAPELADGRALAACPIDVDRVSWLAGWRAARELHFLERSQHLAEPWIPLPGL